MKMLQMVVLAGLMVMILCACGMIGKGNPAQSPGEIQEEGANLEIASFSFTHSGMSMEECFRYSAERTEDGVRLYTEELFSDGSIVNTVIDEPVLEQLGEIAGKYRLDRWNGFNKKNKRALDGSSFSLSITLANGNTVSASGSNRFPDGYADAKQEICGLFEKLIARYGDHVPLD